MLSITDLYSSPKRMLRKSIALNPLQASLLFLLIAFGMLLLIATVHASLINTLLIFFTITGVGLRLCHRTYIDLVDIKLKILSVFWLLKIIITLFLLYVGWIPQLDPSSISWGYDPQRFYIDSFDLLENGWNPLAGANYQGIIYYYGTIFYLFGYNPVIPALINAFVTLLATLFLIRFVYNFESNRTNKEWTIVGLLLIPEVLWYDVMTARETLMAALIIFSVLGIGRYLVGFKNVHLGKTLLLSGTAIYAILAIRTSMGIPVAVAICLMVAFIRTKQKIGVLSKFVIISVTIAALSTGPFIQELAGGSEIDYIATLNNVKSFKDNVASNNDLSWSENSIGLLLKPNNALQALLFLPPRMVLYLAAPLPNVSISIPQLINGSWSEWQGLMTLPTSAMMLYGLPFALSGGVLAWRLRRSQPAPLVLNITFWITWIAVAGGNIVIHERYRIMFTLLLFSCIWFGYTHCARIDIKLWKMRWFSLLATSAMFYVGYKLVA